MKRLFLAIMLVIFTLVPLSWGQNQTQAPSPAGDAASKAQTSAASSAEQQGQAETSADQAPSDPSYIDPNEPLFAPGPLPKGPVSLVGGTVEKVDPIRNRLRIKVIAGQPMTLAFDERTSIFRDGRPVTYDKIRKGDRVYIDTILNKDEVFARNIRINSQLGAADARGQITSYDSRTGNMLVQDELSGEAVSFHVGRDTTIKSSNGSGKPELLPGSLVKLSFVPGKDSRQVREINILAQPGGEFVFAGVITNIDLHLGTLSVANTSDNRTYDIRFDPASTPNLNRLKIGVQVIVNARFSGRDYRASHITVQQSSPASSQAQAQPQAQ